MLVLPNFIQTSGVADREIRFTWDNADSQVAEGETDRDFVERLSKISQRANVAYAIALAEWILGRFSLFPGLELAYLYVEASWATEIDLRYCRVVWEDYPHTEEWQDPVRGPVWLAMIRLQQTLGSLVEEFDPEYTASKLFQLARHVTSNPGVIEEWNGVIVARMEAGYPRLDTDPLGEVVSRELFDPAHNVPPSGVESLIQSFLRSLSPSQNPFLNTRERMLEEGYEGIPYTFNEEQDRARRLRPGNTFAW